MVDQRQITFHTQGHRQLHDLTGEVAEIVGNSGVKTGVFDAAGKLLGLGRSSHRVDAPRPGWAECDPERWWHGLVGSLRQACEAGGVEPGDIAAAGLSVLYPAVAPLDASGRALGPAILYCD